jgi:Phosphotyrosine interaction domain (PTB/PID).
MITIHSTDEETGGTLMAECRVRFLSFLGIGHNVKQCAFIMHTAQDLFIAHVFVTEPSSGALCKTIEAACKVRFSIIFYLNIKKSVCQQDFLAKSLFTFCIFPMFIYFVYQLLNYFHVLILLNRAGLGLIAFRAGVLTSLAC